MVERTGNKNQEGLSDYYQILDFVEKCTVESQRQIAHFSYEAHTSRKRSIKI
ncbi:MAG: hypothetical protein UU23_C0001G0084 [Candidatus Curtissbacteria bacterium GW2011_GWA1_40_9]|uniref:Uncharacterized protein n=1 Tax=Candidatus Curtissbacteria bacterium GW2011_GWA1_40_9 TaxID=1618408 RepID=A0A0G0W204_9BACT|nr:MAG: hypothetical protein UU23_C0001G0084 [Candidatus Curtissbacteria bacterium GW2011_GWA1_40_9]